MKSQNLKRILSIVLASAMLASSMVTATFATEQTNSGVSIINETTEDKPTNPVVDDIFNTFGWTPVEGKEEYLSYEYTINGTDYVDCTANPQPIGNIDAAAGKVGVRLKGLTEDVASPTLFNEVAFTSNDDIIMDFEDDADLVGWSARTGTIKRTMDVSASGLSSFFVGGKYNNNANNPAYTHNVNYTVPGGIQNDKYLTMKFYISSDPGDRMYIMPGTVLGDYHHGIGFAIGGKGSNGSYHDQNVSIQVGKHETFIETASVGWHTVMWDYTATDSVDLYYDGELVDTITTEEAISKSGKATTSAEGFSNILLLNSWMKTENTHYIDDVIISSNKDVAIDVADAPTNPVNDDTANTFGWTNVAGYDNATDYEYSLDGGGTFMTCTSNPQSVGNKELDAGMVMVRVKAGSNPYAGAVLRSTEMFTDSFTEEYRNLLNLVTLANGFFEGDYTDATAWTNFKTALASAKLIHEDSANDDIMDASTSLITAVDELKNCFSLGANLRYDFEKNESELNPFSSLIGDFTKGEQASMHGKNLTDKYDNKFGAALTTVPVDGMHSAYAHYTFPVAVEDYIAEITWQSMAELTGTTDIMLLDESGENGIGLRSIPGNQSNLLIVKMVDGVVTTEDTEIRRLNNNGYAIRWDFANPDSGVTLTLDGRHMADFAMDSFQQIVIKTDITHDNFDAIAGEEIAIFDKLLLIEKNPAVSIEIGEDEADIGYYDTYELQRILLDIVGQDPSYDSTDLLTYTVNEEGKDIVGVTTSGSIEPFMFGEATVTVTSTSGATDSILINSVDLVSESVFLTSSPVTDIIAMGAPGQDTNNSMPVEDIENVRLNVGESIVLNPVISPVGTTERHVTWESSNEDVFVVRDGLVTAVNYGTAILTITTKDGSNLTDTCVITVGDDTHVFGKEIFVATDGDDVSGDGTINNPYATIEKARDVIASSALPMGGVVVYFREGIYQITDTINFNEEHSGTEESPIEYAAYKDEVVSFNGSVTIDATDFELVDSSSDMYDRIHTDAVDKVYSVNVSDLGVKERDVRMLGHSSGGISKWDFSDGLNFSLSYYSMALNNEPMTLARYPDATAPDDGTIKVSKYTEAGSFSRGWENDAIIAGWGEPYVEGLEDSTFAFTSSSLTAEQLAKWQASIDPDTSVENAGGQGAWMLGYWGSSFSDQTVPIQSINGNEVKSALISHYEVNANKSKFYAFNIFEELSSPGEWYIDQLSDPNNLMLYFYPPTGTDMSDDTNKVSVPVLDTVMISITNANYITFDGIDMANMNNGVFNVSGGSYNSIENADITNIAGTLSRIDNSSENLAKFNGFNMCDIDNIDGGISLGGGDTYNLERGYNYIKNSSITNFSMQNQSYNPAIGMGGVGNIVSNCILSDAPHNGMQFNGPESLMEFLEIFDVLKKTGDQACIYTGRDTLNRGSVIRNSYFHDVAHGSVENSGVYLDDGKGGVLIVDNVFENTSWGLKSSGGRDVDVIGNTFINQDMGYVTTPVGYVGSGSWYTHGLNLICSPSNYDAVATAPWQDPNSAYGRFELLWATLEDEPLKSKYSSTIDNTFINIDRTKGVNDTEASIGYNIWCKYWKLEDYETMMSYIWDWMFTKNNNDFSNPEDGKEFNTGSVDASYKTRFDFSLTVGDGMGEVSDSFTGVVKGVTKTAIATAAKGYDFVNWTDASGKVISTNPVYITEMTSNVSLTANFAEKPEAQTYEVTVTDGTGSGSYEEGTIVNITADTAETGMEFDKWVGNVTFADETSMTTSFEMPAEEVSITATYKAKELPPVDTDSTIIIETEKAQAGDEVMVDITLENNPGITSMKLVVDYDEDMLELVGVTFNKEFGEMTSAFETADANSVLILNWVDGTKDFDTADMTYATLKFKVKDTATEGDLSITASYDPEDVFNMNQQNVAFDITEGKVEVVEVVMGDTNSDGFINNKDVMALLQYTSNMGTDIDMMASDLNDDGVIDNKDVMVLFLMVSESF